MFTRLRPPSVGLAFGALCLCLLPLLPLHAEKAALRTWTDVSGKHSVKAVFVKSDQGQVHLRRMDGKLLVLRLKLLSEADRAFVAQQSRMPVKQTVMKPAVNVAGEWLTWRGPHANGTADNDQQVPVTWSETENIVWKVEVPGRGHSSPTVVGSRVLLTTADSKTEQQSVVCFDRKTGRRLWLTPVNRGGLPQQIHNKNTHATPTVACNGQLAFAVFHNHDRVQLVALNLSGEIVWQQNANAYQPDQYKFGYAPSPLLYDSLVIVVSEFDGNSSCLIAYEQATGKEVWRTARPNLVSFSSPIVGQVAGRDQLLISGCKAVTSYDPKTGQQLWTTKATTQATCGTMIWSDQLVFASGGYPDKETVAIRADGSGEVVWRNREKCYEQSMLIHGGHIYAVNDSGIAFCWRASDGQEMWKQRLGGKVSASPTLVGDTIYAANESGTMFVFKAQPGGFQTVGSNQLGTEGFASPAICGNQIFLRTATGNGDARKEFLYCIAKLRFATPQSVDGNLCGAVAVRGQEAHTT